MYYYIVQLIFVVIDDNLYNKYSTAYKDVVKINNTTNIFILFENIKFKR